MAPERLPLVVSDQLFNVLAVRLFYINLVLDGAGLDRLGATIRAKIYGLRVREIVELGLD